MYILLKFEIGIKINVIISYYIKRVCVITISGTIDFNPEHDCKKVIRDDEKRRLTPKSSKSEKKFTI
jgi:hypothetical protein